MFRMAFPYGGSVMWGWWPVPYVAIEPPPLVSVLAGLESDMKVAALRTLHALGLLGGA